MSSSRCNEILFFYFTDLAMRHMVSVVKKREKKKIRTGNKIIRKRTFVELLQPLSYAEDPMSLFYLAQSYSTSRG